MTTNVINIDDARELKELGLPILPVVDMEFSPRALRLFANAEKARIKFYGTFVDYCRAPKPTEQRYIRIKRALKTIESVRNQAAEFTSLEESEVVALQLLLTERISLFLTFWENTLATFDDGEAVTVNITREMFDGWATY